jgi:shikimate kinase
MPAPPNSAAGREESSAPRARFVALIGYRGTGKTTVARLLAERLGWQWFDADERIEACAGSTIKEIFARGGESAFRTWEESVVAELTSCRDAVLALGGGAVLRESNRDAIRRGWVVWLSADAATILQRVAADPSTASRRPNLTTAGGLAEIQQLLAAREPLYRECADFAVATVGKSPEQVAGEIVCFLQLQYPALDLRAAD